MIATIALLMLCLVNAAQGLSASEKAEIVNTHNELRSKASPRAKNMLKMYWNENLARSARNGRTYKKCEFAHDKNQQMKTWAGLGITVGQNLAFASPYKRTWAQTVKGWHSEHVNFKHGRGKVANKCCRGQIGHYTQVMQDQATAVGCAYKRCGQKHFWVCNYAYGQLYGDEATPYDSGSCSSKTCGGRCVNNLCDCGKAVICRGKHRPNIAKCGCGAGGGGGAKPEKCGWLCRAKKKVSGWFGKRSFEGHIARPANDLQAREITDATLEARDLEKVMNVLAMEQRAEKRQDLEARDEASVLNEDMETRGENSEAYEKK